MVEVLPIGSSARIDVIDAGDLRAGMRLLDSTYLMYGVVSEIRRVYRDGGGGEGTTSTGWRAGTASCRPASCR